MNVLLIGCGSMGKKHLNTLRKRNDVDHITVIDPIEVAVLKNETYMASTNDIPDQVDITIIASPTSCHIKHAIQIIEASRVVLLEKPVATSSNEARQLLMYDNKVVVGHIERFNPVILQLQKMLKNHQIFSCDILRTSKRPDRISDVGVDLDLGIHDLDLVAHLFGKIVTTKVIKCCDVNGVVDYANYHLCSGSTSVTTTCSWRADSPTRSIMLVTDLGKIQADLFKRTVTVNGNVIDFETPQNDQLTEQFCDVIRHLNGQKTRLCSLSQAIEVLEVV